MITVCTWLWGKQYDPVYAGRLAAGVRRHLKQPHRFVLVIDDPNRVPRNVPAIDEVWKIPAEDGALLSRGCFPRLRSFDPDWQRRHGITPGDRAVWIDLDTVVTGHLDPLFDRPEPLCILQGGNYQPCRFNGSLVMLRGGAHPELWSEFSLAAAHAAPYHERPDDQGWLWHRLPNTPGWLTGPSSGCYVYQKPGWPDNSHALPDGARYVTFAGWRDPSKFTHLHWVRKHWRE